MGIHNIPWERHGADHITLRRGAATGKIRAARSAIYYFQRDGGDRIERPVGDIESIAQSFEGTPGAKCRIRLTDSQHTVVFSDTRALRTGYVLVF